MARSKKVLPKGTKKQRGRNTMPAVKLPDKNVVAAYAKLCLSPAVQSAIVVNEFNRHAGNKALELTAVMGQLDEQVRLVNGNDMTRAEGMLISQAHALEAMFGTLSRMAISSDLVSNVETYLKLALRAQSQCRATLETLAAIKNPASVAFVRQANISNGPQQINNGAPSLAQIPSRAGETDFQKNKLLGLEATNEMDTASAGAPGAGDTSMAAVGTIHGAENTGGKIENRSQRLQGRDMARTSRIRKGNKRSAAGAA